MGTKKLLILIGFFWTQFSVIYACSCTAIYFCEYIKEETTIVAFQAKVIDHKQYNPQNIAIYLEIIKKYKDGPGMTDTIKIYGRRDESGCGIDVYDRYPIGDTLIVAIGSLWYYNQIINPDSLSENYWEYYPSLCQFIGLKVKNGKVRGRITKEILEYPLSLFDEHLDGCRFSVKQLDDLRCSEDNFIVFPNPSSSDKVAIEGDYNLNTFQMIRVFGADGKLLIELKDIKANPTYPLELEGFQDGLNIIEITCSGQVFYKKIIIEK
jgi:hypothetical protein